MNLEFAKQHNLTFREIGLLWLLSEAPELFTPDNFENTISQYDTIDGLYAIESLKEKGLIFADIMAKSVSLIDDKNKSPEKEAFDKVRTAWPQTSGKRGLEVEWQGFLKACKKYKLNPKVEVQKLYSAMVTETAIRKSGAAQGKKEGEWPYPMFSTWINQARWTMAADGTQSPQVKAVSEKYAAYLNWFTARYKTIPTATGKELTEDQYIEMTSMSGPLSNVKISPERARVVIQDAHDSFVSNPKQATFLYEFIIQKLKSAAV